jgi:hypothetical protein
VSTVPVDLLNRALAVAVNSEPSLATVSEEALVVNTEASGIATLGNGTGVGKGQAEGRNRTLNDVEVLESGGNTVLGGEGDETVGAAATD